MTHKHPKILNGGSTGILTGIAGLLILSNFLVPSPAAPAPSESVHQAAPLMSADTTADCGIACEDTSTGSSMLRLAATQLQSRLSASGSMAPSISTLMRALEHRERLEKRSITITVSDSDQSAVAPATWTVSLVEHPELIMLRTDWSSATFVINRQKLAEMIVTGKFETMQALASITVSEFKTTGKVTRAINTPIARDGYAYDSEKVAHAIAQALDNGHKALVLDIPFKKSTVQLSLNGVTKKLDLLSSGLSDYEGSPEERVWNIHKSINEHLNNVIVKPGEVFSFVDILGGPVTLQKGWREGLGLFGGGAALTPGAGICQAATTTFRAALLAGFPIVEKRNHSMWVDHYEPFGAGLDATIFPGVHDMRFRNDSTSTILIQAFIIGDDVTVNLYGTDDHREVTLDGPYFYNTPHRAAALRPLGKDQVGWTNTVTYADGRVIEKALVATYHKGIPGFVFKKYAGLPGETILHELVKEEAVAGK